MPTFKRYQGKHINSKHPHYKAARWWYQFRIKGKTYTGSLAEANTKKDADDAEATIRAALFKTKYGGQTKDMGFSKYVDESYLPASETKKASYRDDLQRSRELKEFFGNTPIQSIESADCERLKRTLVKKKKPDGTPRADGTINRYMDLLSAIFKRAIKTDKLINSNPCSAIEKEDEGDGRTRSLSADEYERLVSAVVDDLDYMRSPLLLALNTGLRRGELLALRTDCVNVSDNIAHVLVMNKSTEIPPYCLIVPERKHSKQNYTRVVPLNAVARAVLVELTHGRTGTEKVFTVHANGINDYWLKKGFKQACESVDIIHGQKVAGGVCWHDLRRTFATILRANKVHAYDISYLLGHHIEGVTKTYARESLDKLRQAVDTLTEPWGEVVSFNRRVV